MVEDAEPEDGYIDRALLHGELTTLEAPLRPGECGAVARWIGTRSAAVLEYSYDVEAEPGYEYDAFLWTFTRASDGTWELNGGPGFDCPTMPGDRPSFSTVFLPIAGLNCTTGAGSGSIITFGVAAPEVVALEMHSPRGVSRAEVGVFGAVIVATEDPPAEVVLLGVDNRPLRGNWLPHIHTNFTVRTDGTASPGPPAR